MTKIQLYNTILANKLNIPEHARDKIAGWVNALADTSKLPEITKFKKGDVLHHAIFKHPVVLVNSTDNGWTGIMLTSDVECKEILRECRSRIFNTSLFTKNLLHITDPSDYVFIGVYDNNRDLNKVYKNLLIELNIKI